MRLLFKIPKIPLPLQWLAAMLLVAVMGIAAVAVWYNNREAYTAPEQTPQVLRYKEAVIRRNQQYFENEDGEVNYTVTLSLLLPERKPIPLMCAENWPLCRFTGAGREMLPAADIVLHHAHGKKFLVENARYTFADGMSVQWHDGNAAGAAAAIRRDDAHSVSRVLRFAAAAGFLFVLITLELVRQLRRQAKTP